MHAPKYVLPAVFFLWAGAFAAAQPAVRRDAHSALPARHRHLLEAVLSNHVRKPAAGAKTTATAERLVASSLLDEYGDLYDSARYIYSGGRGTEFGANDLEFDLVLRLKADDEPYPHVEPEGPQRMAIRCDSALLFQEFGDRRMGMLYNGTGSLSQVTITPLAGDGTPEPRDRYAILYNATGKRTGAVWATESAVPDMFLPRANSYVSYDGSSRIIADSTAGYIVQRWTYHYDAGGRVDTVVFAMQNVPGGPIRDNARSVFTYDAAGRVTLYTGEQTVFPTTDFIPDFKDSLVYTVGLPFPIATYIWSYNGTALELDQQASYTLNAVGLRDTLRLYNGTGILTDLRTYFYTPAGHLAHFNSYIGASGATPIEQGNFYYEAYDPSLSVPRPPAISSAAAAYPNPANEALQVRWDPCALAATEISLCDAAGRSLPVRRACGTAGQAAVDLRGLPAGFYTLTLLGAGRQPLQHIKIVKQ